MYALVHATEPEVTSDQPGAQDAPMRARVERCCICRHAERGNIEFELSRHVGINRVAGRYNVNRGSVWKHWKGHMPEALKRALRVKSLMSEADLSKLRVEESRGLLEKVTHQRASLYGLLAACEQVHDVRAAVMVHRSLTDNLSLTAKMLGEFVTHDKVINQNLIVSPSYLQLRAGLLRALTPFPDARAAVVAVLKEIEVAAPITPDLPATLPPERAESVSPANMADCAVAPDISRSTAAHDGNGRQLALIPEVDG